MEIIVRIWDCWNCGNKWINQVNYSISTSNISGEKSAYCPKCNHRGSLGSPHKIIELIDGQLTCKDRYPIAERRN